MYIEYIILMMNLSGEILKLHSLLGWEMLSILYCWDGNVDGVKVRVGGVRWNLSGCSCSFLNNVGTL